MQKDEPYTKNIARWVCSYMLLAISAKMTKERQK